MGILLFIIALILTVLLCPIGVLYSIFKMILVFFARLLFLVAIGIDKIGNVVCADLFNDTLIKQDSKYKFGDVKDTISKVLGVNKRDDTLTKLGIFLANVLNWIEKDHVENAIKWV